MKLVKKFVSVTAKFDQNGITPLKIFRSDGRVFDIDRIIDVWPAASIAVGGLGIRYKCKIAEKERLLFYDVNTVLKLPKINGKNYPLASFDSFSYRLTS